MKHYVILAATNDSTLRDAARMLPASEDREFQCVKTTRDAVSLRNLAIMDLDLREAGRSLPSIAGGALPGIAITAKTNPWLSSMQWHHRIEATLTTPVSRENLRPAFAQVRRNSYAGDSHAG